MRSVRVKSREHQEVGPSLASSAEKVRVFALHCKRRGGGGVEISK